MGTRNLDSLPLTIDQLVTASSGNAEVGLNLEPLEQASK